MDGPKGESPKDEPARPATVDQCKSATRVDSPAKNEPVTDDSGSATIDLAPCDPTERKEDSTEGTGVIVLAPPHKLRSGANLSLGAKPGTPNTSDESRYEVVRSVGEGGMGRVYLVADRDLGRHIALK
ncbi:MAG TPA: hypothetical protein VFA18_16755, partial [Gemmataceae bacterium]|nr:hypothetical protein [Gemmataceae bacterium]